MSLSAASDIQLPWRLRGKPLQAAVLTAGLLGAVVFAAAAYDLASPVERRQLPLDFAALIAKLVIAVGLIDVARRTHSLSMRLLAALAGLLAVAGLLADAAIVDAMVGVIGDALVETLSLSDGVAHVGLLFVALGIAALGLLSVAWIKAQPGERQAIGVLILLFMAVGVFTGPVNAIAAAGINREWLFAEDFGQGLTLAVMGGYVAGMAVATRIGDDAR